MTRALGLNSQSDSPHSETTPTETVGGDPRKPDGER